MDLATTTSFTPFASLFGGVLIGLSAVMVMAFFGRIAGISGISGSVLSLMTAHGETEDPHWRIAFLVGLIAAPIVFMVFSGQNVEQTVPTSLIGMSLAGLVVGIGVSMGSGCTSGHGVCGLARLSPRSLVAVITFMLTAGITVFVLRHVV